MIIIEGPDGAGKTTLLRRLAADTGLPLHERAVADATGEADREGGGLWSWVCRDVTSWDVQPLSLYDRHPLISEYVYGPLVRGKVPPGFLHPSSRGMLSRFHRRSLVVFALPPLDTVIANVEAAEQMEGVQSKINSIYSTYQVTRAGWPAWAVDYNYTDPTSYNRVLNSVRMYMTGKV